MRRSPQHLLVPTVVPVQYMVWYLQLQSYGMVQYIVRTIQQYNSRASAFFPN